MRVIALAVWCKYKDMVWMFPILGVGVLIQAVLSADTVNPGLH